MKRKPVVGETLYSLNVGNAARWTKKELTPVNVVFVGRKYFSTCKQLYENVPHMHTQFHVDTWRQKTQYSADEVLYESPEEYHREHKAIKLQNAIRRAFEFWGSTKYTLEQLEQCAKILGIEAEDAK